MIDTHTHLDGEEFKDDLPEVVARAKAAGVDKVFLPAIDLKSCHSVLQVSHDYPGYAFPMLGLHPEEVREDYREQLVAIRQLIDEKLSTLHEGDSPRLVGEGVGVRPVLAIGEVGLDYYWSREFEKEQLDAFRIQMEWSIETRLPLMIHCRKGQNEMVNLMKPHINELPGGVFHCFTGNEIEAEQLLQFPNFVLGIGGVLTFKKSNLPEVLPKVVPLDRIVLETDSPYMAPVPHRGKRNESAFVKEVLLKLAEIYNTTPEEVDRITTATVNRIFGIS